jgi:phosphoribosylcarboxyaminoimidazole (NCAIR) mutase
MGIGKHAANQEFDIVVAAAGDAAHLKRIVAVGSVECDRCGNYVVID